MLKRPRASDGVGSAPPGGKQPPAAPSPAKPVDGADDLGWRRERRAREGFTLRDYLDVAAEGGAALRRKSEAVKPETP